MGDRLTSSGLLGTLRRSKNNKSTSSDNTTTAETKAEKHEKKEKKEKKEKEKKEKKEKQQKTTREEATSDKTPRLPLPSSPRRSNKKGEEKSEGEERRAKMSRSADSPAVAEVPSSPRRSLNPLKLSKKRSDRRLSINQETTELWNRTNSAPVPVISSPGRLRRATLTAADASSADNSVAEKWKKNSAGSPAADKEGIKNLRAAYQAKKAQIMSTSTGDVNKSAVVAPPPPQQAARTRANTGLASPSRPTASNMAIQQARTSYDETDIKDRSSSKAMRAIKMLKRKSLAVPVRDLKDLKNFQGFGDFSEEEEPKTEVNVLVLGDATAGFCDVSHAIAAAQSDADELKARLVDRYMEFVRSQNSVHVRSDTSTTKAMELTFDNRPVALKIVSYDPDKVDPLTLSKINVAIVVFSVVVPSTLDSALTNWLPKVRSLCGHGGGAVPIILVGAQAALRGVAPVSIPQDLPQGYAFAQTNECRAYFELSDIADAAQVGRVFDEAIIAVASPPQQKEASSFVDSLAKGPGERLVLSNRSLTTATLSCLVSPEDRKAGLGGVRCLVLSHNHFTHLPAFIYNMPQLEELRVDNNRLVELDTAAEPARARPPQQRAAVAAALGRPHALPPRTQSQRESVRRRSAVVSVGAIHSIIPRQPVGVDRAGGSVVAGAMRHAPLQADLLRKRHRRRCYSRSTSRSCASAWAWPIPTCAAYSTPSPPSSPPHLPPPLPSRPPLHNIAAGQSVLQPIYHTSQL